MSTLKVTNIENPSTTSGGIDIDTSGHVTVDGVAMPSAGPLSNRILLLTVRWKYGNEGLRRRVAADMVLTAFGWQMLLLPPGTLMLQLVLPTQRS